jgi:esterase/lipase superfamily enzyme
LQTSNPLPGKGLVHASVAFGSAAGCFYNYQEGSGVKSLKSKIEKNYISLFYICFVANIKGTKPQV